MTATAHRLVLGAGELAELVGRTGVRLPPPFGSDQPDSESRGPGEGGPPVHPSVAANLAVLARPQASVRIEASLPGGRSRSVFAVAGPLGASLFALADGAVELSMFPAVTLGAELARAVPVDRERERATARIYASLGGPAEAAAGAPPVEPRLAGRIDWAGLVDLAAARAFVGGPGPSAAETGLSAPGAGPSAAEAGPSAAGGGLSAAEAELAARAAADTHGVLSCLVFGRIGAGVAVGQVVWLATDTGWVGLVPSAEADGRRVVELAPVEPGDLGTWLAPYLAQILDAQTGGGGHAGS